MRYLRSLKFLVEHVQRKPIKVSETHGIEILDLKWSGKTGQRAKMYPTLKTGYTNDEETQFFRQV